MFLILFTINKNSNVGIDKNVENIKKLIQPKYDAAIPDDDDIKLRDKLAKELKVAY